VNRIAIFVLTILSVVYILSSPQVCYSQDASIQEGSLVDLEMQKIQEDFAKTSPQNEQIPQSRLLEELNKPGNEVLLEQLKNGDLQQKQEVLELDMRDLKENIEQLKENKKNSEEALVEEEDDKLKVSSSSELYFDMNRYFESIKDFYGYKMFIYNSEEENDNKAREELYPARNSGHVISPGDSFILTVWGDAEFQRRLPVSSEGTVYIENVGVISVHGLSISEFEAKLKNNLSKKYKTIDPANGNPTTFFDISFDKYNVLNVFVTGEVIEPGPFQMSPTSTIIAALIKAKGVTAKGTLRNIHLIRDGKVIKNFDLYDYLQTGKDVNDIMLQNNDNIFVSTRNSTIELTGEVINPLKYELKADETLNDLIKYSGGLLSTAAVDKITIERIVPIEKRTTPVVYSNIIDEDFTYIKDGKVNVHPVKLYDRDIIKVHAIPRILTDYISINGAVYRKGRYRFDSGMTLKDIITKSGGLLADAYTDKIELIRTQPDQKKEFKSLNITDEANYNFRLNSLDSIKIHSKWDLQSKKVVVINGYIKNPGFEYLADSTKVSDFIFSRGGILDEWRRSRTYLLRAELTRYNEDGVTTRIINLNLEKILNGDKNEDIFLQDGDQLRIFDLYMIYSEGKVTISGYVKNEGEYKLSTNMTVEDLILKANGFREGAYEYKAVIFRMNTSENNSDSLSQVYEIQLPKDYLKTEQILKSNFILKDNDHVVIRKNPFFRDLRKVTISGQVMFPGVYTLVSKDETLKDVIDRAGGLTSEAFIEGTVFMRDTLKLVSDFKKATEKNSLNGIILKDGDDIHVPTHPGTVMVEGYVYTKGLIKFRSDWDLDDYIEAAGGKVVELDFKSGDAVVYYPGGNAEVDNGWFFSPGVKEGSTIVVPKIKKEAFKEWRTEIGGWLGVITTSLTLVLLYQASQN
jgi:polysaccharide export outer membrane protein